MSKHIAIVKEGHEGGLHIDAMTGQITTLPDERPDWADGYAVALLTERTGWYERRLGQQLAENIRKPDVMDVRDLGWVAFDAEGEEVEVEADTDYRMDVLAKLLDVDREDFSANQRFKNTVVEAEVAHTYVTNPTEEATLAELEGQTFGEVAKAVGE
ncbi:hypothetical protein [Brucella intermedia]|uniref:hypothetical protein n=1 Tax=Brucella intermedia TaxID=94625 RepID=UPI00224AFA19|nr:hypothetical protein [Brucella intermedia]